jgi:hypothetical protein
MEGAGTLTADDNLESSNGGRRRRRRRHRSGGLEAKLKRSQSAARMRKRLTILVLGVGIVAGSLYVARTATSYEPLPALPNASE